ncbi:MAG: bifunctional phosphopantothenoylcysteine decarboxylase/phosphopantothenate--cysteine ligase CoaBC [Firmicutes bacterium]|nr:bifunctional phosphopantothenoylcysteine decarboxylase/phosphopantothenate--cysteine ligase CoaBC [Bacillota bacterium]
MNLRNKRVILGVTGSISAYKAVDLASQLMRAGACVDVVMTECAQRFIQPLTFQSITGRQVYTDMFTNDPGITLEQMQLAREADIVVVAPATANFVAKLAGGLADDFLSVLILATRAPLVIAPAMTSAMYENPQTQENLGRLRRRGVVEVPPEWGYLMGGYRGRGRLAANETIVDTLRQVLGRNGELSRVKIVVTAGGTREPVDRVHFLGSYAAGKMGFALAREARDQGADVTLIHTPTNLMPPVGVKQVEVNTAQEMLAAVRKALEGAGVLIMAADVADYRPARVETDKIREGEKASLALVRNPDILMEVKEPVVKVGFATESSNFKDAAALKLSRKGLDLIVARQLEGPYGEDADSSQVSIIAKDGSVTDLPLQSIERIAREVLRKVSVLLKPYPR